MAGEGWGYAVHHYPEAMLPTPPRYAQRQPSMSLPGAAIPPPPVALSCICGRRYRIPKYHTPGAVQQTSLCRFVIYVYQALCAWSAT